ncbi:MAG: hypothetical protein KDB00_19930 [Planctomycetales bacterium]|nr:hypothetical protein [Planctomycetales bacterium]
MRRFLTTCTFACLSGVAFVGCGGHEGGVIDIPLDQNPYQVSDQEQRAMDAAIDETSGLTEEEIEAFEEAKKEKLEQEQAEFENKVQQDLQEYQEQQP